MPLAQQTCHLRCSASYPSHRPPPPPALLMAHRKRRASASKFRSVSLIVLVVAIIVFRWQRRLAAAVITNSKPLLTPGRICVRWSPGGSGCNGGGGQGAVMAAGGNGQPNGPVLATCIHLACRLPRNDARSLQ